MISVMDKLTDGITTDQKRIREDDINIGGTIASILLLLALFVAYYFFG
ncbi:MAG: hypothetical protein GKR92_12340 [Gammaproteobacteria bacterium]|nr:MAG: hypothetical protein GKR92_12340 [Gammaproteobacteria bacterium]